MSVADITVVDSIMGSGKTTWVLNKLNEEAKASSSNPFADQKRYMSITMYLEEAERFQQSCPGLSFVLPVSVNGKKLTHVNQLVTRGKNIASTHALFKHFSKETLGALRENNYTLIIDEVVDVVHQYPINRSDLRTLFTSNMVFVDERNRLRWNHRDWSDYDGSLVEVKNLCDNGYLVYVNDTIVIWEVPLDFLEVFEEVIVLTYLFEGSLMANYLKANGVPYVLKTLKDGELVDVAERDESAIKAKLRSLINIITDPSLNAIGNTRGKSSPLSATWYNTKKAGDRETLVKLRAATENFFRNKANGRSDENMWATFKDMVSTMKGPRYTKGFVAFNTKATNKYMDKRNLAYLVNVYAMPTVMNYLEKHGAVVDQDLYALSEMVQWIWRSQIRRGDPINLFVPSQRMRTLFLDWLNEGVKEELPLSTALAA